jgi:hypothetical protein
MIDMLVAPVFAAATFVLQSAPGSDLDPNTVTPGPIGFAAIFLVAAATILLGFDMVRRIRRTTYRAEIKQRLEAEIAAKEDKPE